MHKHLSIVLAILASHLTPQLGLAAVPVHRKTETTEILLTFTKTPIETPKRAARYWGVSNRRILTYPALLTIEYAIGARKYAVPRRLVVGMGSINVDLFAKGSAGLVVRDDDRWTVITLRGGDGSNAFIAEWRIERSTGCVIRFVRDLEAPGRLHTEFGPELLGAQAIEVKE
jgi:hypothetical protein